MRLAIAIGTSTVAVAAAAITITAGAIAIATIATIAAVAKMTRTAIAAMMVVAAEPCKVEPTYILVTPAAAATTAIVAAGSIQDNGSVHKINTPIPLGVLLLSARLVFNDAAVFVNSEDELLNTILLIGGVTSA